MPEVEEQPANIERDQTDESLRAERQRADHALGAEHGAVEAIANAVIEKARKRADGVLAAARAKLDLQLSMRALGPEAKESIDHERLVADLALRRERSTADEAVRRDRRDQAALLRDEREETDEDLSLERAGADEALATRDEFLGIVSHDLRNMLGTMVGFAQLILREEESPQPAKDKVIGYAQRIHRASGRMSRLIGDLVDVASIQAGTLVVSRELGDPTPIVLEAVEAFQAQALASGIALNMKSASAISPVLFDSARLLQLLINLLSNAVKFTPRGGSIDVGLAQVASEIRISVRDTGKGIAKEDLQAIFQRYLQVTPDRRGVGLGLYISQCIAQGHGGRIWAESKVGEGSTFYFAIPIPAREASEPQAKA